MWWQDQDKLYDGSSEDEEKEEGVEGEVFSKKTITERGRNKEEHWEQE